MARRSSSGTRFFSGTPGTSVRTPSGEVARGGGFGQTQRTIRGGGARAAVGVRAPPGGVGAAAVVTPWKRIGVSAAGTPIFERSVNGSVERIATTSVPSASRSGIKVSPVSPPREVKVAPKPKPVPVEEKEADVVSKPTFIERETPTAKGLKEKLIDFTPRGGDFGLRERLRRERRLQQKETAAQTRARQRREKQEVIEQTAFDITGVAKKVVGFFKEKTEKFLKPSPEFVAAAKGKDVLFEELRLKREEVDVRDVFVGGFRDVITDPFLVGTADKPGGIFSPALQKLATKRFLEERKKLETARKDVPPIETEIGLATAFEDKGRRVTPGKDIVFSPGQTVERGKAFARAGLTVGRAVTAGAAETTEAFAKDVIGVGGAAGALVTTVPEAIPEVTTIAALKAFEFFTTAPSPKETGKRAASLASLAAFAIGGKGLGGGKVKGRGKGKGEFTKIEAVGDIGIIEKLEPLIKIDRLDPVILKTGKDRFKLTQDILVKVKETKFKKRPKVDTAAKVLRGERQTVVEVGKGGVIKLAEQDVPISPEILKVFSEGKRDVRVRDINKEVAESLSGVKVTGKRVEKKVSKAGLEFAEKIGEFPDKAEFVVSRLESGKPFKKEVFDLTPSTKKFSELISTGRSDVFGDPILSLVTREARRPPKPEPRRPISTAGLETQLGLTSVLKERIKAERGAFPTPEIPPLDLKVISTKTTLIRQATPAKPFELVLPKAPKFFKGFAKSLSGGRPFRSGAKLVSTGKRDPFGEPILKLQPFEGKIELAKQSLKKDFRISSPIYVSLKGGVLDLLKPRGGKISRRLKKSLKKDDHLLRLDVKFKDSIAGDVGKKKPDVSPLPTPGKPFIIRREFEFEVGGKGVPDLAAGSIFRGVVADSLGIPKPKKKADRPVPQKERQQLGVNRIEEAFDLKDPKIKEELIKDPEVFRALTEEVRERRFKQIVEGLRTGDVELPSGGGVLVAKQKLVKPEPKPKVKELVSLEFVLPTPPTALSKFEQFTPKGFPIVDKSGFENIAGAISGKKQPLTTPPFEDALIAPTAELSKRVFGRESVFGKEKVKPVVSVTPFVSQIPRFAISTREARAGIQELKKPSVLKTLAPSKLTPLTGVESIIDTGIKLRVGAATRQDIVQVPRLDVIQKLITAETFVPRPPRRPPPFILFPPQPRLKRFGKPGFDVLVRRRGVFKKVSRVPLSRREAFALGAFRVDKSLAASFKLVRSPLPARAPSRILPFIRPRQFRPAKREKGVIVERRRFRLSRRAEVSEIQLAKRLRQTFGGF